MTNALVLDNVEGLQKKVSLNVPTKDASKLTIFTLPLEDLALSDQMLDSILGRYTHRSWYNKRKDGVLEPMSWIASMPKGQIAIANEYECDGVEILPAAGGETLVFEAEQDAEDEEQGEDEEDVPTVRVTDLVFTPQIGGVTKLSLHLQVKPGLGAVNLELQRLQYRRVIVTLGNTKLLARRNAAAGQQQSLGFHPPGATRNGEPHCTCDFASTGVHSRGCELWPPATNVIDGTTAESRERSRADAR